MKAIAFGLFVWVLRLWKCAHFKRHQSLQITVCLFRAQRPSTSVNRGALFECHIIIEVIFNTTSAPHHGESATWKNCSLVKISFVNDPLTLWTVVMISYSLVRHPLKFSETKVLKAFGLKAAAGERHTLHGVDRTTADLWGARYYYVEELRVSLSHSPVAFVFLRSRSD